MIQLLHLSCCWIQPKSVKPSSEGFFLACEADGQNSLVGPFYGAADIDVTEVGALPLGTTNSDDPLQPGVLVIQNSPDDTTARSLIMRLGSETNSRNAVPFDGGYTVLRVRLVRPDSMLGSWASGTVTEVAAGFFCAVRQSTNL